VISGPRSCTWVAWAFTVGLSWVCWWRPPPRRLCHLEQVPHADRHAESKSDQRPITRPPVSVEIVTATAGSDISRRRSHLATHSTLQQEEEVVEAGRSRTMPVPLSALTSTSGHGMLTPTLPKAAKRLTKLTQTAH
jgi:hypothetical protein